MMEKLDKEERELAKSFERGEWRSVGQKGARIKRYREFARATFKRDHRVNIRISGKDLDALKKRALEEGLPYQTLISSVLHKFVSGRLKSDSSEGADSQRVLD
jgi:predicted DNA binding CopG/RHH family protein